MAKQAKIETTAVFVKFSSGGNTKYKKMPFTIEVRDYAVKDSSDTRGRKTYLNLGNGRPPGRALMMETGDGEIYDAVLYLDVYPDTWPRIGNVSG